MGAVPGETRAAPAVPAALAFAPTPTDVSVLLATGAIGGGVPPPTRVLLVVPIEASVVVPAPAAGAAVPLGVAACKYGGLVVTAVSAPAVVLLAPAVAPALLAVLVPGVVVPLVPAAV